MARGARDVRRQVALALVSIAMATSLSGCGPFFPLIESARSRAQHAELRERPETKATIQLRLGELTCFQLSEWEQVVLSKLKHGEDAPAVSWLNLAVLRDDVSRIRDAMAARGCPTREQMLAAGTPSPAQGSTLKFACVCWQPYAVAPIVKEGAGPAGPDCFTVRAEVSPGSFAFFENVPTWGERRHDIDPSDEFPLLGSLDRKDRWVLIVGASRDWNVVPIALPFGAVFALTSQASSEYRIPPDAESDGWIETSKGRFRLLTDDCRPLSSEQASVVERTVIRWIAEPLTGCKDD